MKRAGNIYNEICDIENIKYAIRMAGRRKQHHRAVAAVFDDIDSHAEKLQKILIERTYTPAPYKIKEIKDGASGKIRTISCPKFFPDQVIHWAVVTPLQPVMSRGTYAHAAGGTPGRGAHQIIKTCQKWIKEDLKNTKYILKLDVRKFYQSVDNTILKQMLRRVLKDPDTLWLLDQIIDSSKGLPIGNYTSVWLSDFYMQGIDNFIKQDLKITHYVRYVDDMILFGRNKKKLHKDRQDIDEYLNLNLHLSLKENWQVFPIKYRDLDFLGYRINRDRVILRKITALRIRRRAKRIARKRSMSHSDASAMVSYMGMLKSCNSYNFKKKHIWPFVNIKNMRRVISRWQKQKTTLLRTNTKLRDMRTKQTLF